jgi:hypothetical protein
MAGIASSPAMKYARIIDGPPFVEARPGNRNKPELIIAPVLSENTCPRLRDRRSTPSALAGSIAGKIVDMSE